MRTLFITSIPPIMATADTGGKHRRAGIFLRALGRISTRIDMVCMVPESMMDLAAVQSRINESQTAFWQVPVHVNLLPRRRRQMTAWNYYGAGVISARQQEGLYPYSGASMAEQIGRLLDSRPDIVFADRLDAMMPILASGRKARRLLLDVDDLYHRVRLRSALAAPLVSSQRALALHVPSLILSEYRAIAASDLAFVCSEADVAHLHRLHFPRNISAVPNAVTIPPTAPGPAEAPTVLYLGSFYHPPNVLAAERLIGSIWPLIRAQLPFARLLIAGAKSEYLPSFASGVPGVTFMGFVEDLDRLYAQTRLVCAPITTGSGTRLKLLEAAAYARPMVSTHIGAEGLDFRDGYEILLRDDDMALAAACVDLLRDDSMCARYGSAGRAMVQDRYNACRIQDLIAEQISEVCYRSP